MESSNIPDPGHVNHQEITGHATLETMRAKLLQRNT